jgi:hypothetical protein
MRVAGKGWVPAFSPFSPDGKQHDPTPRHPLGQQRERFFWPFAVGLLVLCVAAVAVLGMAAARLVDPVVVEIVITTPWGQRELGRLEHREHWKDLLAVEGNEDSRRVGWRSVADRLRDTGHDVHTPTLTGLGDRAHLATRDVGLATHVRDVVATIVTLDLAEVVLAGQSYGGMVVTGVVDHIPERI